MAHRPPTFEPGRRYRAACSTLIGTLALVSILCMVNYLASTRWVWRRDLSQANQIHLSPLSLQTLHSLTNELNVTVLFDPESALFPYVNTLLREYALQSRFIKLEVIDSIRDPYRARMRKVQHQLGENVGDVIVFELGGQRRVVSESELSVYNQEDIQKLTSGGHPEIRRSGFTGERRFTSAIAGLINRGKPRAIYLTGHKEHIPNSEARESYSHFLRLLVSEKNLNVDSWNLATNDIPTDCQLVVIAGPTGAFTGRELEKLDAFLLRGGRLFLLLNPSAAGNQTGLEGWLRHWAVDAPPRYAGDIKDLTDENGFGLILRNFGSHALMAPLRRAEGTLYFPLPRVVGPIPPRQLPADAPKVDVLVATSPRGMTKSDLERLAVDPARDSVDVEVPVAVAVEKGGVSGVTTTRGGSRLVIVGDSYAFTNDALDQPVNATGNNHDLAALCISWLIDRPTDLAIGPKPIREWKINLSEPQVVTLRWVLLGGLPGASLFLGLTVWFRRRA
jgi:ABC-type uncharacterized transport system